MIYNILNSILLGNKIQSVQIRLDGDQKDFNFIELHKKKKSISIINRYSTKSFEDLITKLSKNKPVILSITGQGILSKKVKNEKGFQSKILFNADPNDFYWNEYIEEEEIYVSVARKDIIDKEIALFDKVQIPIIDFTVGPFISTSVKPLIEEDTIHTDTTTLYFEKESLLDFEQKKGQDVLEYVVGDEIIFNTDILGFASTLNYLYPNDKIISETSLIASRREEFRYKKAFNIVGVFTLSFFLVSLLLSYILLGNYQSAHHKIQVALGEQNVAYSKLVSLENDKENKEAILNQSGLSDSNFLSFYISKITKEVPDEINLKVLTVFPAKSKIKSEQRIYFENNVIEIEGYAQSNDQFSSWIKVLKTELWIKNLEIISFQRENRTNSFKIKLILKFDV
ncbi:Fimbrial assembly protein (PilN) [Aquimarina amphilecti]|uniref:Fimbrial assembly protein (PilN) n=1 Tax=Aquimarina amphilecti TaxID=1038014 RepID=A0A1H7FWD3_AQUAM|nr:PilN domain-containing protein [Aquimarina amphilecti]SEK30104.1 Fimbrial assembly protein (PilN) [Aquimarina amphilecti]